MALTSSNSNSPIGPLTSRSVTKWIFKGVILSDHYVVAGPSNKMRGFVNAYMLDEIPVRRIVYVVVNI